MNIVLYSVHLAAMPPSISDLRRKKVLMLGAGFVTKPTLEILSTAGIRVTVGTVHTFLAWRIVY